MQEIEVNMTNILYTQAKARILALTVEQLTLENLELIDKVYDLEVQLAREKHRNEKPVNRCPEVWPDKIYNEYVGSQPDAVGKYELIFRKSE